MLQPTPPLSAESGEFPELARLKLQFNRKSFGVLRRLINVVNAEPEPETADGTL